MKESINLASTFVESKSRRIINLGKLKIYLRLVNVVVSGFIILELLALAVLSWQTKVQATEKINSEKKLASLLGDTKLVDSLLNRQKQLNYIEKQRPNLKSTVSLIEKEVPENSTLTSLKIHRDRAIISAITIETTSLSQFIGNLIESKYFKKISLTQSTYNQDSGNFNFTLECLIN